MPELSAYSHLNNVSTLDGVGVQGLWEGDNAIEVQPGADVGQLLVGVQGDSIFSQTADRSARITIRLMHTSATHRQLVQKWQAQRAGNIKAFGFDTLDISNNEGGNADKCLIAVAPNMSLGMNATVREWVLVTGDWKPLIPNAETI